MFKVDKRGKERISFNTMGQKLRKINTILIVIAVLLLVICGGAYIVQDKLYSPDTAAIKKQVELADNASSENDEANTANETIATATPEPTPELTREQLTLVVNRDNKLPEDFPIELVQLSNGQQVNEIIYPELQQMFNDMRAAGIYPIVREGYRTQEDQEQIYDEKYQEYISQGYSEEDAKRETMNWVAVPGYSEHQLGMAVDINADGVHSAGWDVYNWLAENAYKYGFILRYPEGKEALTYTSYEPWHYRYVGKEDAKKIYEQGICLEAVSYTHLTLPTNSLV